MNAQAASAIAQHLQVATAAILEIREWARVLWVRVQGLGCRFVSKKVTQESTMSYTIEYVQGSEQHSSNWAKFYVKGLEEWAAKEDFAENRRDSHHQYQGYTCLEVPAGTMFSVFIQDGNKWGTDKFRFLVCEVVDASEKIGVSYGSGFIEGAFRVVAEGSGNTKAPRLMDWWIGGPKTLAYAEACAAAINKRGQKAAPTV